MIGAVFQFEMLKAARRQRGHFLRWTYAAFLLAQIAPIFYLSEQAWQQLLTGLNLYGFFERFLVQHFVFLALLTPLLGCGAITEEKMRGTLQYLLTADLRPGEIILGKMAAHLYQLGLLTLVGLPLLAFFAGLAGDITFPLAVLVASLGLVFGILGPVLLLSVWCRTTRDALLCAYLLLGLAALLVPIFLATPLRTRLIPFNPLRVLALEDPSMRWRYLGEFLLGWVPLGMIGTLLASWRLRRAYRKQLQIRPRIQARWWLGKPGRVRGNPILWREQKVEGIAPLESLRRWPRWLGMAAVLAVSAGTLGFLFVNFLAPGINPWRLIEEGEWSLLYDVVQPMAADVIFWQGMAALLLLTLAVAIRASGAITGEKEKGTWQAIMLTPLTTEKIIAGKHWGIFWACLPYVVAHAAFVVPVSLAMGFEALTWAVLMIGCMILAIILSGAVGLWCSARARSSWRSLLTTLFIFYLGWLLISLPISIILFIGKALVLGILSFFRLFVDTSPIITFLDSSSVVPLTLCVGLALAFWSLTHHLLAAAVARVGQDDRTKEREYDYYQSRAYLNPKPEEPLPPLHVDGLYEWETTNLGEGKKEETPIPLS